LGWLAFTFLAWADATPLYHQKKQKQPLFLTAMKTIASFFFAFALSLSAFANDGDKKTETQISTKNCMDVKTSGSFQGNLYQNAQGRISLILLKNDSDPFLVKIIDSNDNIVFSEKIKEDSIRQNFFLKEMEPGDYRFTVTKNGECFAKTVTVK
jgi:hypothetical protein